MPSSRARTNASQEGHQKIVNLLGLCENQPSAGPSPNVNAAFHTKLADKCPLRTPLSTGQPNRSGEVSPRLPALSQARQEQQQQRAGERPPLRWKRGKIIGSGGFSTVYIGMDLNSRELMAVKHIGFNHKDPKIRAQLHAVQSEIRLMRDLEHPHIVKYICTERLKDSVQIFMEYVPGGSIQALLQQFGAMPDCLAKAYTGQILSALQYLHSMHVLHCDVKGANVLVSINGDCKLSDFGSAAELKALSAPAGAGSQGTACWMAPEVVRGDAPRYTCDIWSLGCTVMEMLTARAPWAHLSGTSIGVMRIVAGGTQPLELPPELNEVCSQCSTFCMACLALEPTDRPSAVELLDHPWLAEIKGRPAATPSPPAAHQPAASRPRRGSQQRTSPRSRQSSPHPDIPGILYQLVASPTERADTGTRSGTGDSHSPSKLVPIPGVLSSGSTSGLPTSTAQPPGNTSPPDYTPGKGSVTTGLSTSPRSVGSPCRETVTAAQWDWPRVQSAVISGVLGLPLHGSLSSRPSDIDLSQACNVMGSEHTEFGVAQTDVEVSSRSWSPSVVANAEIETCVRRALIAEMTQAGHDEELSVANPDGLESTEDAGNDADESFMADDHLQWTLQSSVPNGDCAELRSSRDVDLAAAVDQLRYHQRLTHICLALLTCVVIVLIIAYFVK